MIKLIKKILKRTTTKTNIADDDLVIYILLCENYEEDVTFDSKHFKKLQKKLKKEIKELLK